MSKAGRILTAGHGVLTGSQGHSADAVGSEADGRRPRAHGGASGCTASSLGGGRVVPCGSSPAWKRLGPPGAGSLAQPL